ncbi:MAG TPA: hypothetical protein VI078_03195 [bacterium]
MEERPVKFGIAWFKPEQWSLLREISEDKDELEDDYETWLQHAQERVQDFQSKDIPVEEVLVDVYDLSQWCKKHKVKCDAEARSRFASEEVRKMHKPA